MSKSIVAIVILFSMALAVYFKEYSLYGIQRIIGIDVQSVGCATIDLPKEALPLVVYDHRAGTALLYGLLPEDNDSRVNEELVIVRDLRKGIQYTFTKTRDEYVAKEVEIIENRQNENHITVSGLPAVHGKFSDGGEWVGIPDARLTIAASGSIQEQWWNKLQIVLIAKCQRKI